MGSAALSPTLPARSRAWPLASTIRTLPIVRVRPERFVSETTAAALAVSTRSRDQTDMEHLQRRVVGGTALVSADAVERAGEFDDFDIAFSGCFRLDNADVIDLYDRVQVGAKVLSSSQPTFPDARSTVKTQSPPCACSRSKTVRWTAAMRK
jgi:hypothetical protein